MKNLNKVGSIFLLLLLCSFAVSAQKTSEATIVYKMEMNASEVDERAKEMMQNATTEIAFKGKYTRVTTNIMMSNTIVITNNETNETVMLIEAMGNTMAMQLDKDQLMKSNKKSEDEDFEVVVTDETMNILEYVCKKVIVKSDDGGEVILYVSDAFKPVGSAFQYTYPGVSGMPLRIEAKQEGSEVVMTAISANKSTTGKFSTDVPEGAQKIDFSVYEKMQQYMK